VIRRNEITLQLAELSDSLRVYTDKIYQITIMMSGSFNAMHCNTENTINLTACRNCSL